MDIEDTEACYRAVKSRDRRFDGVFFTGVTSTGIYCRPSCPAVTPAKKHATFHRSAAAAQAAGFRACKRCLPDATPGSPDWDVAADVAGRAMRLIVRRVGRARRRRGPGVTARLHALATSSGCSSAELGAGPLALARARRAQNARISHRDHLRCRSATSRSRQGSPASGSSTTRSARSTPATPTRAAARIAQRTSAAASDGRVELRLPVRQPFAAREVLRLPRRRAMCRAWSTAGPDWYERTLDLPHGAGRVAARRSCPHHHAVRSLPLDVKDLRDVGAAVERCRRLRRRRLRPGGRGRRARRADPWLAGPGARAPGPAGARAPSTARRDRGARRARPAGLAGGRHHAGCPARRRRTAREPRPGSRTTARSGCSRRRPRSPSSTPRTLPMPRARGRGAGRLSAAALADGDVVLDRSADRAETRAPSAGTARHRAVDRRLRRRCVRSATRTSSCPPTWRCAAC